MSFQAYIDGIFTKTGKKPEEFAKLASKNGLFEANVKTAQILDWLKTDFDLNRGYGMAIIKSFKEKGYLQKDASKSKKPSPTQKSATKTKVEAKTAAKVEPKPKLDRETKQNKAAKTEKTKPMGAEEVVEFIEKLEGNKQEMVKLVRQIILKSRKDLTENIKWKAPNFMHEGEDLITFNLQKDGVLIIFHRGVKVKDSTNFEFKDTTGLLDFAAKDRAKLVLADLKDIKKKQKELAKLVNDWIKACASAK